MKLKNKRTGEIGDIAQTSNNAIIVYYPIVDGVAINPQHRAIYESLAELNMEWEDVPEEPKAWWYIDIHGPHKVTNNDEYYQQVKAASKEIGNYFKTREEAEKAVERLRAWKRLKDKGFVNEQVFSMNLNWCDPDDDDWEAFHLLFGGEE